MGFREGMSRAMLMVLGLLTNFGASFVTGALDDRDLVHLRFHLSWMGWAGLSKESMEGASNAA